MKNGKNYNIGLDIGVGSVGWCVTDENSNLLKKNGKNMWGSRIFEEAKTAADTRTFRLSRRRLGRRRERINILQSLIQEDMEKEYPNFFPMLRESSLVSEDKNVSIEIDKIKYNLFSESEMTDAIYFEKFPTIYHLRKYLIDETNKVDIRLVYLAIHHIIKYRGNFLHEGNFVENLTEVEEKLNIIIKFLEENYDIRLMTSKEKIFEVLIKKNITKTQKKEELMKCFDYEKTEKSVIENILKSFLGNKFDISKIFDVELEKSSISFAEENEDEEKILSALQENEEVYFAMNTIYSWYVLQDILKGKTYISEAFIGKYEKYGRDLNLLKNVYRKYFPDKYDEMFRKIGEDNYVAYNGKNSGSSCKKCKPEDFFANLKKKIEKLDDSEQEKEYILKELADNNFLKKINVTDNGEIPHQLHEKELKKILENQSKYYKTLEENKDKIISLFEYRIPYYVGPLAKNNNSKWAWLVRKNNEKIRPWNFNDVVDEDATAEKFINRMTNKCTYILNENVMPKQSILYSEFCVLNELNNIRIDNNHISKNIKNLAIEKLFKNKKKVTKKAFEDLLRHEGITYETITGLSDNTNFNSNMASYIDMKSILGKIDESNIDECEELIYWITIFEEKKILRRKIEQKYTELTKEQIDQLVKKRYTGWSRLSKRLLTGLKSNDGETIMDKLRNTTMNFMQIINSEELGFDKQLEELMPKSSGKIRYKDVAEIPTSPANKRAIWQTVCVVEEITKIMKSEPKNIYIEFARSEELNKTMKDNRAKQLLKKYEDIEKQLNELKNYDNNIYKKLKQHQSDKTLSEKMYLYFIQNGKCMYSGEPLNIENLSEYEVDHIIPQSYKKDDSIDNKALVLRKENQRKKDNLLLLDEIIDKQTPWWESLLKAGLISQTKYYRLTKRKMFETEDNLEKFVKRQLVETRQITKYVTNLLMNEYSKSSIFSLRAELTHSFRENYEIYKNRNVNNYHHAQDAYILCTIGNILDKEWHGLNNFKYGEYVKNYLKDDKGKNRKHGMIMGVVNKHVDIKKVKTAMNYKDCYISRMLIEQTGEFYHQTLYSPKKNPVIALKSDKSAEKYGGYSNEYKAYCVIFEYTDKKGKEFELVGIPVQIAYDIKNGKVKLNNYIQKKCLKDKQYFDFKIIKNKILLNQEYLDENNELMRLSSDREIRAGKELIVNEEMSRLIYFMNCKESSLDDEEKEMLEKKYVDMYNYLLKKLHKEYNVFSNIYIKLKDASSKFENLDVKDKKSTLNGLIDLMGTGQGNLKAIGLSDREGRMAKQKFGTKKLKNMTFIDKSVTGMYERRYKIDGMENSCNK